MTSPAIPKRYEVRSLLGEGGSGRVYRVQDSIRDRELALKLVTPAESAFLRREFDTLRQIRHENLIQVFDWGALPSGEAYYTMELIEGGGTTKMGQPQSADDVRRVLTGLLRGLAHLHCHGEIHGDLKPGNILLGAGGVVKIADAGMGGSAGRADSMSGTPGYAAPEVWEGAPADVRSDLYSVGVMAYEALTGKHPFAGRTVREVISGQLEGWVPSPGAHGVRVPADLERVVMRALERKPGLRQGSADEFMEGFGVEDRIGEILGGKLVGREKEIAEIESLLYSEEPGTATLLYVTGEPGIGKTTLLEEVAARILGAGGCALEIDLSRAKPIAAQISEYLGVPSPSDATSSAGVAPDLHALLWEFAKECPVLLYAGGAPDRATNNAFRGLARYVWALSLEQSRGSRVLIALRNGEGSEEPFVKTIHVDPMSEADCGQVINKTLGSANLQPELISRLHALSGGNPGVLRSTLASLIERELLFRRDGVWTFREATQIHSLGLEPGVNPWAIAWKHLGPEEQRTMLTVSLFRRPIPADQLQRYASSRDTESVLSTLLAKGWVRQVRGGWIPASDGVRQAVQELGTRESQAEIAASILAAMPNEGDSEERADLELRYRPSLQVLDRGLQSAERAVDRGEQGLAVERLGLCLGIAQRGGLAERVRAICLRIASLLHQQGDEDGAESYLERDEYWGNGDAGPADAALRSHLLGQIAMSKGDLVSARKHLTKSIELAGQAGNTSLFLRSHADLAEIDWRHGDERERRVAIDRMREVLAKEDGEPTLREERAALMYELGAAMVVAGASRDSIDILTTAFRMADSEYWKMRISNALSSAHHYLGAAEGQLKWLDEAWGHAERSRSDFFKARILSNRGGMLYHQGRLADAADQDRLSANWARRVGNTFEFIAGCAGAGICHIHLASYEEAFADARDVMSAARVLKDPHYIAKALELEALANYLIGREGLAEKCIREALDALRDRGHIEVKPRLDWLLARILRKRGELEESRKLLSAAEVKLLETRDPEDLWGVQIEMHLIDSRKGGAHSSIGEIERILRESEKKGLVIVAVPATLAIAEILDESHAEPGAFRAVLTDGLERAERTGMRELAWQLSYRMGALTSRAGDQREGQARYTHALRILREIAAGLSDDHRKSYLGARHVASAIREMESIS
jgi:tetratricopeptide (TPR) repeat protein